MSAPADSVAETGGATSIWFVLNVTPLAPMSLAFVHDSTQVRISPATVSLGPADTAQLRSVTVSAVVRRTEVTAVFVVAHDGTATLRQIRLGQARADKVEVLAGLSAGERIALDPLSAAHR